ncbi:MAG: PBP1A family penicillin-binding protein, partial [Gammaproteobacteria bacterium]|nr:PBP1A family penicillin-binding protein [Gammaproteobacteria bacterium]
MLRFIFYTLLLGLALIAIAIGGVAWWVLPQLPPAEALREVRLQTPLRVLSADGLLIAEFGEKRRQPVVMEEVPQRMIDAFLAAEDDRFYSHPGVDWMAIARAAVELAQTGEKNQGGSTITMQVARNFFLSREKTYERKIKEIVLALKIERELSKDAILELYLNKIFLGHRSYGIGAAAQVYYGRPLGELTLPEMATIAALPKAPSTTNPVSNPLRAVERRGYVLARMLKLGMITQDEFDDAVKAPVTAELHALRTELDAPYIAEMVRDFMVEEYGDAAYTAGYTVHTTILSANQAAANRAILDGLSDYDKRHGYRGPEHHFELEPDLDSDAQRKLLSGFVELGKLRPALVIAVEEKHLDVLTRAGDQIRVAWDGLSWARRHIDSNRRGAAPKTAADVAAIGDVIRLREETRTTGADGKPLEQPETYWRLAQIPEVEGALVSLAVDNGAILALTGGFDFNKSKFNRVTQARRQPGSNFKPFIYSAALDQGFTAASFINDAPIVFDAPGLENTWRPENYSGKYYGPTRLREALTKSRNLVSVRLLNAIGIDTAIDYVQRFGFDTERLPHNLSLSLGSGELTPLEVARGYAVIANGGFLVDPYFVDRVVNDYGDEVYKATPVSVCRDCEAPAALEPEAALDLAAMIQAEETELANPAPRVVDEHNAWIMNSILRDVVTAGTGRRALALKRTDLGGKTGT